MTRCYSTCQMMHCWKVRSCHAFTCLQNISSHELIISAFWPLMIEYSVSRASYDLSMTDISEIARNSVYQSGFENHLKEQWLGEHYKKGVTHCDENKTHVPLIRAKFRAEHLALEHSMVILLAAGKGTTLLQEMMHQFGDARSGQRNILFSNMTQVPDFPEQNQL
mmetsp:Transcript_32368/g.56368  ORF Transcript_32368/g.56368 Transcript_32368/m.56368 type:complete len:165 (-) Transcript_32368:86-580(-)